MKSNQFCSLARRLLQHPAAPYFEHAVRTEAQRICDEHGLTCRQDRFGNLLVRLRTASGRRPLVLAAHLDHPGFEMIRRLAPGHWLARFRGGVPEEYFRRGVRIRLMPGAVPARLGRRRSAREKLFEISTTRPTEAVPVFGVWELEDYFCQRGQLHARACDDLIGVAVILATLIELKRARARVHVVGVLSRAEEVGFQGALALASARILPRNALIISLETSRELPAVKMGLGPILRVGDRASTFDSQATRFLAEVGGELAKKGKFAFQRGLMSGGTCEATAYQEFGYQSTAVCVTLGNYHNCGPANRIKPEYINVSDACGLVTWLTAAATHMPVYRKLTNRLPQRLARLLLDGRNRLQRTSAEGFKS